MVTTLLKDLSQNQTSQNLSPYNDEGIRISIDEYKNLYQEFLNCLKISELDSKMPLVKLKHLS